MYKKNGKSIFDQRFKQIKKGEKLIFHPLIYHLYIVNLLHVI